MKKILVATDFSERSDRAIRRATVLAKTTGASLALVHVVDDDQPASIVRAERQATGAVLEEQARSLNEIDGVACTFRVVLGDPFEGLAEAVRNEDADLLLVGPHRRQVLKDVFIGTTAERTIRASDRPVLMANGIPAAPYRHILVAVDLSSYSAGAIRTVRRLGLDTGAAVSVVHVFDASASGLVHRAAAVDDRVKDYVTRERKRASAELEAFLKDVDLTPVQKITRPEESSVAQTICAAARDTSADLVVVGTHGRTGVAKALLGSVAEQVLRSADRDVLAVPPARRDEGAV